MHRRSACGWSERAAPWLVLWLALWLAGAQARALEAAGAVEARDASDAGADADTDRTTSLPSLQMPGELSLSSNVAWGVATAGAVLLGALGVAALLALALPLFGLKLCYLTGSCDPAAVAPPPSFAPMPAAHAYDAYSAAYGNAPPSTASNAYQRRSLEYVGPILRMLSDAYDKYAAPRLLRKQARGERERSAAAAPAPEAQPPRTASIAAATTRRRRR